MDVQTLLDSVASPTRRRDAQTLLGLMGRVTGEQPHLWGTVIGFGRYHYASGRELRPVLVEISPSEGGEGLGKLLERQGQADVLTTGVR